MAKPHRRDFLPVDWVSKDYIRRIFNEGDYLQKIESNELVPFFKERHHPSNPPAGEPICTWSELLVYYTEELDPVVEVHRYLRPDQTIGASGRLDPKRIFLEDRVLAVQIIKRNKPV
jgi:hypothetical protein